MAFSLRFTLALSLTAIVAACSPLRELQESGIAEQPGFNASLATEYLGFAESEAGQGREEATEYFAGKGLLARDGADVLPEKPRALNVAPGDEREDLQGARRRLLSLRGNLLKHVAPRSLARAQVLYDCWAFQKASGELALAESCRSGFLSEVRQLESVQASQYEKGEQVFPAGFVLYFTPGSAALDHNAHYVIEQVRSLVHFHPDYAIDVSGHTDSVGSPEANLTLSQKRAEAVTRALVEAGIAPERITTAWLGEDDPQTPALDETSRKENRRVEIDVSERRLPPGKQGAALQE